MTTPKTPAHDMDSAGGAPAIRARRTYSPRRTQPPSGSSGKHPLPNPWPQPAGPQMFPEAQDVTASPTVASANWLPEPDYWMADHQRIPRPPTRPIARPQRFRRMSRAQSALLAVIILIVAAVIGAGMLEAGRLSHDLFNNAPFFNAPQSAPTAVPTTTPTTGATVTPTLPATQP